MWWHCARNILWCLLTSAPILCSDSGLGSTGDGHLGKKFPGSVIPQGSLARLLRNSARERQNRVRCTNKEVSLFQDSYISGAMSSSKFSQVSPLLIIATWQNGKCACSWLGEECMPVIIRDLSQMSTESTLHIFSANVSTLTPSQLSRYVPTLKMKCTITDWKWKYKGRENVKLRHYKFWKQLQEFSPLFASI